MSQETPRPEAQPTPSPRERILLERLAHLEHELAAIKADLDELRRRQNADSTVLRSHEARLDRLRIDKQLKGFPSWVLRRLGVRTKPAPSLRSVVPKSPENLLILAPKYPSKSSPYGGQPVERRLGWYKKAGFQPMVLVPTTGSTQIESRDGIEVLRTNLAELDDVVSRTGRSQIIVHHPTPEVWDKIRPLVGEVPIHLWIHGFEARDWRDADFGSTAAELTEKAARLDAINVDRQRALAEAFSDDRVTKIFVSEFVRRVATDFVGVDPTNARVIHNLIDTDIFEYKHREPESRLRILTIKSFAARSYATDLVRQTIERLSERALFEELQFEIRGDGKFFDEDTKSLAGFENVTVNRGFVSAREMAALMHSNGVLLTPTRLDTQGITMGEAMATGMAIVTNRVAAIPEFIDDDSGLLAGSEDVEGLATAIERLYENPQLFESVSENAANRVRRQCGPSQTVQQEIDLIKHASKSS